jgi:type I restriction enzyme M protein
MNPPFGTNASYPKEELLNDVRWKKYGIPRERPANYAWMSHAVHHLAPKGRAGIVMPRGTLASNIGGDDSLRKAFLDDDIIECIVDLPGQLFFNTPIPSCLWFFNKNKKLNEGEVLFIDARKLGSPISRTQIEFADAEINAITDTFNEWIAGKFTPVEGFAAVATREQIEANDNSLTPGRYVGTEEGELETDDDFATRISSLIEELQVRYKDADSLKIKIDLTLKELDRG